MGYWQADSSARDNYIKKKEGVSFELPTVSGLKSAGLSGIASLERAGSAAYAGVGAEAGAINREDTPLSLRIKEDLAKLEAEDVSHPILSKTIKVGGELVKEGLKQSGIAGVVESKYGQAEKSLTEKADKTTQNPAYRPELNTIRDEQGNLQLSKLKNADVLLNQFAQGLGTIAPVIASGIAAGPTGAYATGALLEKGSAQQEFEKNMAEQRGISVEELSKEDKDRINAASTAYGLVAGALEAVLPSKFAGSVLGKKAQSTLLKRIFINAPIEAIESFVTEGTTEGIQRFGQNVIQRLAEINKDKPLSEGVVDEAITGAISGGPLGLVSGLTPGSNQPVNSSGTSGPAKEPDKPVVSTPIVQNTAPDQTTVKEAQGTLSEINRSAPQVKSLIENAIDTPITEDSVVGLSDNEKQVLILGLQTVKNATPDKSIRDSIDLSLSTLGVKIEKPEPIKTESIKQVPVEPVKQQENTSVEPISSSEKPLAKQDTQESTAPESVSSMSQEHLPYQEKRYFIGLQGEALKKFESTGKIPKADQAFGGEFSISDDYSLAKQYTGDSGKVIEVKPRSNIEIGQSSMDDGLMHDISDVGDGEYLVGGNYAIKVVSQKVKKSTKNISLEPKKSSLPKEKVNKNKAYEKDSKPVKESTKKVDSKKKKPAKKTAKKSNKTSEKPTQIKKQIRPVETEHEFRIMTELELSEAGQRFYNDNQDNAEGPSWVSQSSTFPDWIPDHLRRRSIIDPVLKHIQNGTLPRGKNQVELYNELAIQLNQSDTPNPSFNFSKKSFNEFMTNEEATKLIREIQKETNPNIQAVLQFRIFKKWVESGANGQRFITRGIFDSDEMTVSIGRNMTKEEFKQTLKHEIRHVAFHLMSPGDKFKVLSWYKSLSERELLSIYGDAATLNNYRDRYGDDEMKMADETANWNNDNQDVKSLVAKAIQKAMDFIHKVLKLINVQVFKKASQRKSVEELYNSVFQQEGGENFSVSEGYRSFLMDKGHYPGRILIDGKEPIVGMADIMPEKLTTDSGSIRAQEIFNAEWKKLYGVDAPKNLMNLLTEGFNVGNTINRAFKEGRNIEKSRSKDAQEFRTAAELYVKEYVPKSLQGEFISDILKAHSSVNLDYMMKKVEKVLEKEKKSTKELEKRLGQEFKLREKFKKMREDFKRSKIEQREKNAKRLKEVRRDLMTMFKEKTAKAQEIKSKVVEYVKLNIPKNGQGQFLSAVKNAKTQKNLEKIMARVDEKRSQYERANLVKSIVRVTDNIDKLPVDLQRTIVEITSQIELKKHTKRLLNRLRKTKEYLDKKGSDMDMPRRVLNELGILDRTPFEQLSTEKLIAINNRFQQYNLVGRNIMKDKIALAEKEKNDMLAELKEGSVNIDHTDPDERLNMFNKHDLSNPDDLRSLKEKTKDSLSFDKDKFERLRISLIGIDRLFNRLDKRSDYTGPNYRIFKEPVDEKWNQWQHAEDTILMAFYKMINELKLTEKNSERIAIYAYAQQRGGKKKLIEDRKFTEKQIDAIKLNDKEMTVYNFMRRHLDDVHEVLSQKMEKENNVILGKQENYFPMLTDYGVAKPLLEEMQDMSRLKSVAFGQTKERKENAAQVLKLDAFQVFDSYIGKATYFTHLDSTLSRLNKLASSEIYRQAVGENAQRTVLTWLDVMARKGGAVKKEAKWEEKLNEFNGKLSVVVLGIRITTIAKQPLALLDGAAEIGAYAFKGTRSIIDDRWREFMRENSSEMRNRSGGDLEFERLTHNQVVPRIQDKAMYPIKFMDFYTAGAVWTGAYEKKMDELGLDVDFEKPNKEAIKYANLVVRKTQSSGAFKDLPTAVTNEYRTVSKLMFKFQTFVLNRWSYLSEDLPDKMKNDKYLAAQQLTFLSLSMMLEAAISSTWYSFITGDDEEDKSSVPRPIRAVIASTLGSVPFLGQLISSLNYGATPVPLIEFANKFFESLRSVFFAKNMDTREKHALRTLSYSLGIYFGLPTEQARQLLEKVLFPSGKAGRDF